MADLSFMSPQSFQSGGPNPSPLGAAASGITDIAGVLAQGPRLQAQASYLQSQAAKNATDIQQTRQNMANRARAQQLISNPATITDPAARNELTSLVSGDPDMSKQLGTVLVSMGQSAEDRGLVPKGTTARWAAIYGTQAYGNTYEGAQPAANLANAQAGKATAEGSQVRQNIQLTGAADQRATQLRGILADPNWRDDPAKLAQVISLQSQGGEKALPGGQPTDAATALRVGAAAPGTTPAQQQSADVAQPDFGKTLSAAAPGLAKTGQETSDLQRAAANKAEMTRITSSPQWWQDPDATSRLNALAASMGKDGQSVLAQIYGGAAASDPANRALRLRADELQANFPQTSSGAAPAAGKVAAETKGMEQTQSAQQEMQKITTQPGWWRDTAAVNRLNALSSSKGDKGGSTLAALFAGAAADNPGDADLQAKADDLRARTSSGGVKDLPTTPSVAVQPPGVAAPCSCRHARRAGGASPRPRTRPKGWQSRVRWRRPRPRPRSRRRWLTERCRPP